MAIRSLMAVIFLGWLLPAASVATAAQPLRVLVLESAPTISYRDADGHLTGFTIEIARAVCAEMGGQCELVTARLDQILELIAGGAADIAAVNLLDTPERRQRILMSQPFFRSRTLWFAPSGIAPGAPGVRVVVVRGSAQERYALAQSWAIAGVATNSELPDPLQAGAAQAALIPMLTALGLQGQEKFRQLGLHSTVMDVPALSGDVCFGISPKRPELKAKVDAALERIKRNGVYDRINSQFFPFRVN